MKRNLFVLFSLLFLCTTALCQKKALISIEDLPQNSQQFINQHFKSLEIHYCIQDYDSYEVKFSNDFEIEFDKKGEWEEIDCKKTAVPTAIIPENIWNYVQKKFAQTQIVQIKRKLSEYEIELSNDLELIFDKKGKFKRIDN